MLKIAAKDDVATALGIDQRAVLRYQRIFPTEGAEVATSQRGSASAGREMNRRDILDGQALTPRRQGGEAAWENGAAAERHETHFPCGVVWLRISVGAPISSRYVIVDSTG